MANRLIPAEASAVEMAAITPIMPRSSGPSTLMQAQPRSARPLSSRTDSGTTIESSSELRTMAKNGAFSAPAGTGAWAAKRWTANSPSRTLNARRLEFIRSSSTACGEFTGFGIAERRAQVGGAQDHRHAALARADRDLLRPEDVLVDQDPHRGGQPERRHRAEAIARCR